MTYLTEIEKKHLIDLIEKGKPLPPIYKGKLFAQEDGTFIQATKEYRLVYEGKSRREDVIAGTPEAPFQLVRQFNEDNPSPLGFLIDAETGSKAGLRGALPPKMMKRERRLF